MKRIGVLALLSACGCTTQYLVVPAYFAGNAVDPNTQKTYWSEIPLKKNAVEVVVADCSFPELITQNPQAVPTVQKMFQTIHDAGGYVLGYVDTKFGTIQLNTGVDNHCDNTKAPSDPYARIKDWYNVYGNFLDANGNTVPGLDGIFFDDGPTYDSGIVKDNPGIPTGEAGFQAYYNGLYSDFKTGKIVANASAGHFFIFQNASQYPYQWVIDATAYTLPANQLKPGGNCDPNTSNTCAAVADWVVTFEQSWNNYQNSFVGEYPPNIAGPQPPTWWSDGKLSYRTANVIFNVDAGSLSAAITLSGTRKVGQRYFLDCAQGDTQCQQFGGYGRLPTYWSTEDNAYPR